METSVTRLLDLPYAFSQRSLLLADDFCKEADRRGLRISREQLEALHRANALTPLFRLQRDWGMFDQARASDPYLQPFEVRFGANVTRREELLALSQAGHLHDPSYERFRPWTQDDRIVDGEPVRGNEYLYSPWQLLLASDLQPLLKDIRYRRRSSGIARYHLVYNAFTRSQAPWSNEQNRALCLALSALEARYLPDIVHVVSGSWAHVTDSCGES